MTLYQSLDSARQVLLAKTLNRKLAQAWGAPPAIESAFRAELMAAHQLVSAGEVWAESGEARADSWRDARGVLEVFAGAVAAAAASEVTDPPPSRGAYAALQYLAGHNWPQSEYVALGELIRQWKASGLPTDGFEKSLGADRMKSFAKSTEPTAEGEDMAREDTRRSVFVIHGRNGQAATEMHKFIAALGLHSIDFYELRSRMGGTPTVAEIVTRGMDEAHVVIALFTSDEYAQLRPEFKRAGESESDAARWQARPNVIFEAGMAFGRAPSRVLFVLLGSVQLFTDVAGIHVLRPTNDTRGDRSTLRKTLRNMGCPVSDNERWQDAGDFEGPVKELSNAALQMAVPVGSKLSVIGSHDAKLFGELDACLTPRLMRFVSTHNMASSFNCHEFDLLIEFAESWEVVHREFEDADMEEARKKLLIAAKRCASAIALGTFDLGNDRQGVNPDLEERDPKELEEVVSKLHARLKDFEEAHTSMVRLARRKLAERERAAL